MRTKYPYGLNDRAKGEDTNKPFGLQFPSISRVAARTPRPRTTSEPTANTAIAIFEQIYLIINKDIKNAYFHVHVILNTVKKKMLQLAGEILYRNNNPSDLKQYSILDLLDIIDSKLYRPKTSNKKPPPKTVCIINFQNKAIEYIK